MTAEQPGVLIGIDLGTSSTKVLACTPAGVIQASAARSYPLQMPRPEIVELDALVVSDAARAAFTEVRRALPPGEHVRGIGFSGAMHGLLPVDRRGEPLGPVVTWLDRRAAEIAERWHRDGTAAALYAATGAPVHPMLPSCKLRWFREREPASVRAATRFVSLKELLVARWTGEWLVDYGVASGTGLYDPRARTWSALALNAAGIEDTQLSTLAATSAARPLRPQAARELGLEEGVPVVLGSSDGALANLGVGATHPGEFALSLGTSGALRVVLDEPHFDAEARTFCYAYDDRRYLVGGATNSGGAVLDRFAAWLLPDAQPRERIARAAALASAAPPGARGVTVGPFLAGERAPYWRAGLRGTIAGLDLSSEREDLVRAVFEGAAFTLRSVYDVLRERLPEPRRLRLGGGLAHEPFVRQLLADTLGCETLLTAPDEASAFGAAMLAGLALGFVPSDAAVAAALRPLHAHAPQPESAAAYTAAYARFAAVVRAALRPP